MQVHNYMPKTHLANLKIYVLNIKYVPRQFVQWSTTNILAIKRLDTNKYVYFLRVLCREECQDMCLFATCLQQLFQGQWFEKFFIHCTEHVNCWDVIVYDACRM